MLQLQGAWRRLGVGVGTVALASACLGATAPPSLADDRGKPGTQDKQVKKHAKHRESAPAKKAQPTQATEPTQATQATQATKPTKPMKAQPAKATPSEAATKQSAQVAVGAQAGSAGKAAKRLAREAIELDDLLLPGELGDDAHDVLVRRAAAVLGAPLVVPSVTPAVAQPVVLKQPKASKVASPRVPTEVLLDVTTVTPVAARSVLPPRQLASSLMQGSLPRVIAARAASARAATARVAGSVQAVPAPAQTVDRAASRFGSWPAGPVSLTRATADMALTIALGGLVLALAAARGVGRMRHPQTDDPDLSFPNA